MHIDAGANPIKLDIPNVMQHLQSKWPSVELICCDLRAKLRRLCITAQYLDCCCYNG